MRKAKLALCALALSFVATGCGNVNNAAGEAANAVNNMGERAGQAVNQTTRGVGNVVGGAGRAAGNMVNNAAGAAGDVANNAAGAVNNAAGAAGRPMNNAAGTANGMASNAAGYAAQVPSGVNSPVPRSIAGAPKNIRIPMNARPALIKADRVGTDVRVTPQSHWHGSSVTLYYMPADDVAHKGTHLQISRANGVQQIGKYRINQAGKWKATWYTKGYSIPPHTPLYLLALADSGQMAIVQVDTVS